MGCHIQTPVYYYSTTFKARLISKPVWQPFWLMELAGAEVKLLLITTASRVWHTLSALLPLQVLLITYTPTKYRVCVLHAASHIRTQKTLASMPARTGCDNTWTVGRRDHWTVLVSVPPSSAVCSDCLSSAFVFAPKKKSIYHVVKDTELWAIGTIKSVRSNVTSLQRGGWSEWPRAFSASHCITTSPSSGWRLQRRGQQEDEGC